MDKDFVLMLCSVGISFQAFIAWKMFEMAKQIAVMQVELGALRERVDALRIYLKGGGGNALVD